MMRAPTATYRIQFNADFGFRQAAGTLAYLDELGISDLFASPIQAARRGSAHGYDVIDPNRLNPELGSREEFSLLADRLKERHMGWLQDIVPNHMAFDYSNRMLADVLENGKLSEYEPFFDVEWEHPLEHIKGKLMAPFLGRHYAECLRSGEITLALDEAGFTARYYDLKFPLRLESYLALLSEAFRRIEPRLPNDDPDYILFFDLLEDTESLPITTSIQQRREHGVSIKRRLGELVSRSEVIRAGVQEALAHLNSGAPDTAGIRLLDRILMQQIFRLCNWKIANIEINYRRFFDINELIALRQEDSDVFKKTHELTARLMHDGLLTGLRVDHIDGLADPARYLRRLRRLTGDGAYLAVEKILGPNESLPDSWPVQGTTGYDFADTVNGLFVRTENEAEFSSIYEEFTGLRDSFEQVSFSAKQKVLESQFSGDLDNLVYYIKTWSGKDSYGVDSAGRRLRRALSEIIARFPVYRTYMDGDPARAEDVRHVKAVVASAIAQQPDLRHELTFLSRLLLGDFDIAAAAENSGTEERRKIVTRFQQLTAPLMAKGYEDTALYRYNRLLSLNDVGGNPGVFGIGTEQFHRWMGRRAERWPLSMNASATHDSKRGEDARARLNVLSEIPGQWRGQIEVWQELTRAHTRPVAASARRGPDRNEVYLLYQTLLGAWPFDGPVGEAFAGRIKEYMLKAVREAKVNSSWLSPDTGYEEALGLFVDRILAPAGDNRFLDRFLPFCRKVAWYGVLNSLSQCLIKITAPGIPDFYQGSELLNLSLVDPDNRRAVDFDKRARLLREISGRLQDGREGLLAELLAVPFDGRLKMYLVMAGLSLRRRLSDLFSEGTYIPLAISGRFSNHVIAYARRLSQRWSITIVPRFLTALVQEGHYPFGTATWRDTLVCLPEAAPDTWRDELTGRMLANAGGGLAVGEVMTEFPVVLLTDGDAP